MVASVHWKPMIMGPRRSRDAGLATNTPPPGPGRASIMPRASSSLMASFTVATATLNRWRRSSLVPSRSPVLSTPMEISCSISRARASAREMRDPCRTRRSLVSITIMIIRLSRRAKLPQRVCELLHTGKGTPSEEGVTRIEREPERHPAVVLRGGIEVAEHVGRNSAHIAPAPLDRALVPERAGAGHLHQAVDGAHQQPARVGDIAPVPDPVLQGDLRTRVHQGQAAAEQQLGGIDASTSLGQAELHRDR